MKIDKYLNHDVADYAKNLAVKLGLNTKEIERVYTGSMLHDIGKITTPKNILNKPGPLTKNEWKIMRTHTIAGFNILNGLNQTGALVAFTHHEKWNGTGYPLGLSKYEIPLITRITSIADVYDALKSKRIYKEVWGKDRIVSYMKKESGESFDPDVLKVFLSSI